ncbi:hypothetical protein BTUL_0046g00250 [Botrytis tulipae]|uniref:Uncharacterized protein n=1 Tax=Botrytis tulipae TaxID=87230 RepID=A0A4Z1ERM2_9HELO|nr:hypothetical protein BTUL_0046g00250 [Botrytis tulipae]
MSQADLLKPLLEGILDELKAIRERLDTEKSDRTTDRSSESKVKAAANTESSPNLDILDKKLMVPAAASNIATNVPQIGIPTSSASPLSIHDFYSRDLVKFTGTGRHHGIEDIPARLMIDGEEDNWSRLMGDSWQVPEDGRWRLTFAKRWLLGTSPDQTRDHLERVHTDENAICQWLNGQPTTVVDIFDSGRKVIYMIGKPKVEHLPRSFAPDDKDKFVSENLPIAPWSRIILMTGRECRHTHLVHEIGRDSRIKFSEAQGIPRTWRGESALENITLRLFYYEIQKIPPIEYEKLPEATPWNIWRTGKLHSEKAKMDADATDKQNHPRVLLYSEYNLMVVSTKGNNKYWTLLEMRPAASVRLDPELEYQKTTNQEMLVVFTSFVSNTMTELTIAWTKIIEYFDGLISEKMAFRDPDNHDRLLVDDETFSKSKKYFWAISILKELHVRISKNIEEIKRVMDDPRIRSGTASTSLGLNCEEIGRKLKSLQDIANRLSDKREEALDLRDGLFNASGVMESRASTRLGENAVWSINDTLFSLKALTIAGTLIAVSTYATVFNLDNLMFLCRVWHRKLTGRFIARMKDDTEDLWKDRAANFAKFYDQWRNIEYKPSDWRLLQYSLRCTFRSVRKFPKEYVASFCSHTIQHMKADDDPAWQTLARQFEDAQLDPSNKRQPSNWRLLSYQVHRSYKKGKISASLLTVSPSKRKKKDEESIDPITQSGNTQTTILVKTGSHG